MVKRVLVGVGLGVVGLPVILLGGTPYFLVAALLLGTAAWEYGHVFRAAGYHANDPILVGGVLLILAARAYDPGLAPAVLTTCILIAMIWHLIDYERGRALSATDFTVTVAGIVYLGWIGAYLVDLRNLPNGMWWFWLVLPAVWIADAFAYFIGVSLGRHAMTPRLSPKKTWEGFAGGVGFCIAGTAGLAVLLHLLGGPAVTWWQGAILGLVISILTVFGDLGESMFKRQAGVKDTSNLLPGHGGVLDRMDSWLWAAALGYFFILVFLR
jgi:phosphatidate cytidylyltransferase